jgi:hypothetical protein
MAAVEASAASAVPLPGGAPTEAEAFRRIYPQEYLERFLAAGTRADDRPLGRARPATCAPLAAHARVHACKNAFRPCPKPSPPLPLTRAHLRRPRRLRCPLPSAA